MMNSPSTRGPVHSRRPRRFLGIRLGSVVAGVAAVAVSLLGTAVPANAQVKPPGEYFEIDFTAAEPTSYNHLTGGGAYDTGRSNIDTVQSLEGKQFACGDIVSFMTKIKLNDAEAGQYGATKIRMYYRFDMASTGSANGVGFSDLIYAKINDGPVVDLLEPTSLVDDAITLPSTAKVDTYTVTKVGALWQKDSYLDAAIDISGIKAGDTTVLQVDLKIKCDPTQATATGNVQAKLENSEVIAVASNPTNTTLPDHINSGIRTIPMKSPGDIHYPQVSIQKTVTTATGSCSTAGDGIAINSGEAVKYCFTITNPSNILNPPGANLYQLRVKDDNGTPGNSADDFWLDTATITGLQNLDGGGQLNDLAPGVTAYASIVKTITGAQGETITNTATAYGDDAVIDPYTLQASDTAHVTLFVPAPAVDINKTTNNETDPLPSDNPYIFVGETVHWYYEVTNIGNVPLNTVTVTDNRSVSVSCPKSTLAIAEKMTCTANGTAVAGTYTNIGTVVAHYNSETVTASDPSGYFGRNPQIDVTKLPATQTVVQGETATFTITVTNTGNVPLTSVSLSDPLTPTCAGSLSSLAVGESTTVTCSRSNVTTPFTNTVVASGYGGRTVYDTATAAVDVDYLPNISVVKTANPTHVSELGETVTFTVAVTNNAVESFTLNTLSDSVFGNLDGVGSCDVPSIIDATQTYTCTFEEWIVGEPSTPHMDTVTASGVDPQGHPASDDDSAIVTFDDVLPDITVTKAANPTHVSELGGAVLFTVTVQNVSAESVTLGTLNDSVFGNLAGLGTCATGGTIAGGGTYVCTFSKTLSGQPATPHVDTVTAVASDNDGNSDTATASATVAFDNVMPDITVVKTANPTTLPVSGGYVDYLIRITNVGQETVTITSFIDTRLTLTDTCTAIISSTLVPGAHVDCVLSSVWVVPDASGNYINNATATGCDDDGYCDTDTGTATVVFNWYGRTPGYWKNHLTVWPSPYTPSTLLNTVFTSLSYVTAGPGKPQLNDTLLDALNYQGGSGTKGAAQILLRAAVSAVLNEQYYGSWYPATSVDWITSQVNDALKGTRDAMLTLATKLDKWNNGIEASMP